MRDWAGKVMMLAVPGLLVLTGAPTLGRLAYIAGLPGLTLSVTQDQGARGAALYVTGHYAEADTAFREIGRGATYNRAATLALTGDYALAVAYYEAVLFADRWDTEARLNRDIVAGLLEPVIGEAMGHGRIDRLLIESGANVAGFDASDPTAPTLQADRNSRRPVSARAVGADADWLGTLADAPGEYLTRRLIAEYKRRVDEGLALPQEPSSW